MGLASLDVTAVIRAMSRPCSVVSTVSCAAVDFPELELDLGSKHRLDVQIIGYMRSLCLPENRAPLGFTSL